MSLVARGLGFALAAVAFALPIACGLTITGSEATGTGGTSSGAVLPPTGEGGVIEAGDPDAGESCSTEPALRFDGVDDFVEVPHDSELDLDHPFTVEAWIRPSARITLPLAEMHIVSHHDHGTSEGWVLLIKAQRIELRLYGSNPSFQTGGDEAAQGYVLPSTWAHVAGVFDGTTLRVFHNGVFRGEQQLTGGFSRRTYDASLRIGRAAYENRFAFEGEIDDVRISDSARYIGSLGFTKPSAALGIDSNTVALWRFDEASGDVVVNSEGDDHVGTILGTTAPARVRTTCIPIR